jgi:hypothetical protein
MRKIGETKFAKYTTMGCWLGAPPFRGRGGGCFLNLHPQVVDIPAHADPLRPLVGGTVGRTGELWLGMVYFDMQ